MFRHDLDTSFGPRASMEPTRTKILTMCAWSLRAPEGAEEFVTGRQRSSLRRRRQTAEGGRAAGAGDAGQELQTSEGCSGEGTGRGKETYVSLPACYDITQGLSFFFFFLGSQGEVKLEPVN